MLCDENVLLYNDSVTCDVYAMDADNNLTKVEEPKNIVKTVSDVKANSSVLYKLPGFHEYVGFNSGFPENVGTGLWRVLPEISFLQFFKDQISDFFFEGLEYDDSAL